MIYSEIQSRVKTFLDNRTDLDDEIQAWINDVRKDIALEDIEFEYLYTSATITTSAATANYNLPTDYLGHEILMLGSKKLARVGAKEFALLTGTDETISSTGSSSPYLYTDGGMFQGEPSYYIFRGMTFDLYPVPDTTYTVIISYYSQPISFTTGSDEDYIARFHPMAIIFGAALMGAIHLEDNDKIKTYSAVYDSQIKKMKDKEKRVKYADSFVRMRAPSELSVEQIKRNMKVNT